MSAISGITSEDKFGSGKDITESSNLINKDILNMINCPTILTGMSHEMRTHMNSIVAFSFLMNNGVCGDGERKEYSNQIAIWVIFSMIFSPNSG
jgi:hypothetical protein